MSLFGWKKQEDKHLCPVCAAEMCYSNDNLAWECPECEGEDFDEYATEEIY